MASKKQGKGKKKAADLIAAARESAPKPYDPGAQLTQEIKEIIAYNDRTHRPGDRVKVAAVRDMLKEHGHPVAEDKFQEWVRRVFGRASFTKPE